VLNKYLVKKKCVEKHGLFKLISALVIVKIKGLIGIKEIRDFINRTLS